MNSVQRRIVGIGLAAAAVIAVAPGVASAAPSIIVRPPTKPAFKFQVVPKISTRTTVRVLPSMVTTDAIPLPGPGGAIASQADLTKYAMPIGDQGSLGSCVAWTVDYGLLGWWASRKGILKSFVNRLTGKVESYDWLHPMFGFHRFGDLTGGKKTDDPYKNEPLRSGSWVDVALADVEDYGAPPSTEYTGSLGTWDYFHEPSLIELAAAGRYRIREGSWQTVFSHTGSAAMTAAETLALKWQLLQGHPVALHIRVDGNFKGWGANTGNATGVFNGPTTGLNKGANHAVLALGFDSKSLLIQNSWGSSWGEKGWIRVSWAWAKWGLKAGWAITNNSPFLTR